MVRVGRRATAPDRPEPTQPPGSTPPPYDPTAYDPTAYDPAAYDPAQPVDPVLSVDPTAQSDSRGCAIHTRYAYCVAMSVRHGLLALLERGPRYGYQLRAEFERTTGGTWPLNIGQVYTTLARLERDGLVRALPENDGGQRPYEITPAGRAELALWFASPIERGDRPRDELAIKLALALTTPGVDVRAVVQTQRTATVRTLQELTRLKGRDPGGREDMAWRLVLESMVFQAEAEVRWLDHCEAALARFAATPAPLDGAAPAANLAAAPEPELAAESTVDGPSQVARGTR